MLGLLGRRNIDALDGGVDLGEWFGHVGWLLCWSLDQVMDESLEERLE